METKKIDFTKSLLDFDGKEVIDNNAPMTFKGIGQPANTTRMFFIIYDNEVSR